MHMLCLCAFEVVPYLCCKLSFVSIKCLKCTSLHRPRDFTWYSVSILKVWWEIFSTLNVAKCQAMQLLPKFRKILLITITCTYNN